MPLRRRKAILKKTSISDTAKSDISWWIANITCTYNVVSHGNCETTFLSDASLTGWEVGGGVMNDTSTGGKWTETEANNHINYLGIFACFLKLKAFCSHMTKCHIKATIPQPYHILIIWRVKPINLTR